MYTRLVLCLTSLLVLALPSITHAQCAGGQRVDDGSAEFFTPIYYGAENLHAMRFFPPSYPYRYTRVCALVRNETSQAGSSAYEIRVYRTDGANGDPGTLLSQVSGQVTLPSQSEQWITAELDCNYEVKKGNLWIVLAIPFGFGARLSVGVDTDNHREWRIRHPSLGWYSGPSSYGVASTLMIRAEGAAGAPLAVATPRNGSGTNPTCYGSSRPIIGQTWNATVDTSGAATVGATFSVIQVRASGSSGVTTRAGELLIDLASPLLFSSLLAASGGIDTHSHLLPNDTSLQGIQSDSQAIVLRPTGAVLCNAYRLTIGCR